MSMRCHQAGCASMCTPAAAHGSTRRTGSALLPAPRPAPRPRPSHWRSGLPATGTCRCCPRSARRMPLYRRPASFRLGSRLRRPLPGSRRRGGLPGQASGACRSVRCPLPGRGVGWGGVGHGLRWGGSVHTQVMSAGKPHPVPQLSIPPAGACLPPPAPLRAGPALLRPRRLAWLAAGAQLTSHARPRAAGPLPVHARDPHARRLHFNHGQPGTVGRVQFQLEAVAAKRPQGAEPLPVEGAGSGACDRQ